jgi:hypothetical protein
MCTVQLGGIVDRVECDGPGVDDDLVGPGCRVGSLLDIERLPLLEGHGGEVGRHGGLGCGGCCKGSRGA